MSSEWTPEDVASRSFGHSLRGYDQTEVRAYLESVADQLRRLHGQYLAARQELGVIEDGELATQIDNATTDINEVLQAARNASEQMRDRAAREASSNVSRAEVASSEISSKSQEDAYALRQSAWDTSTQMLDQVAVEYARLRQQADRDALAIVGEAERDAHKKLATTRRDSETKVRTARLESERMLVDARAARDEMIESAERATEAAQERTRALERRREELMTELEELRLQREAPPDPVGRGEASTVRVVPPGDPSGTQVPSDAPVPSPAPGPQWIDEDDVRVVSAPVRHAPWADGSDTVRLVESPLQPEDDNEVDADEVASEVARLRAGSNNVPAEGDDQGNSAEEPPETPSEAEDPSFERDLAKAWSSSESRPVESADDLGSLFRELRTDEPDEISPDDTDAGEQSIVAASEGVSEETPLEALIPTATVTPFELRDLALLPITNRALRDVKRQLADVQNLQLDALKGDPAHWQPGRDDLESRLSRELVIVQREAYAAGYGAAHEMLGTSSNLNRVDAPDGESGPFISALFDEVVLTVQAGREAGHGARDLGMSVSRVYRVWRTDEAERRMRHLAGSAYHNGLLRAFADAQLPTVHIDVHGSCDECAQAARSGISVADVDVLPLHDECRCTIVP